jgi:EAL domain-containing protein (putative c-di-GMP-specific phosphodiesterase class I)
VGTWAYDYFHPDDIDRITVSHQNVLAGAPFTVTYRLRRSDGAFVWVETTNRPILDARGETVEIVCCTREVADRDIIVHVTSSQHREKLERVERVLSGGEIKPVFQPVVELETGRTVAVEALARFPGDPAYTPDKWFRDAWEVGLGVPLELLAVTAAARALPRLPADIGLHINASPLAVASPGFLSCVQEGPERVTVELTEHLRIDDYDAFEMTLRPLREKGMKTAIDDFGAGYASLKHILRVRPDWIKLDISLTERIDEDEVALALATSLASFARAVDVDVVAEGIETKDQLEAVVELGLRHGQGFYFGVPAPLDAALAGRRPG